MPKRSRKMDHPNQLHIEPVIRAAARRRELAAGEETEGTATALRVGPELRAAIGRALKKAKTEFNLSRSLVAKQMSELLGVEISQAQVDAWTAESKAGQRGRHIPAEYLPALCHVCRCAEAVDVMNAALGRVRDGMVAEILKMTVEHRERERQAEEERSEARKARQECEKWLATAQKLAVAES